MTDQPTNTPSAVLLLQRLARLTTSGKIQWKSDDDLGGFYSMLSNFWVNIRSRDSDGLHPYDFGIYPKSQGPTPEPTLSFESEVRTEGDERAAKHNTALQDLYRLAADSLHGDVIEAFTADLDLLENPSE
jgi:hypothetical protein